jgi:hypothetical protein
VHPELFVWFGGGVCAEPDVIYCLCLVWKTVLKKSCHKYNCNVARLQLHIYVNITTLSMTRSVSNRKVKSSCFLSSSDTF